VTNRDMAMILLRELDVGKLGQEERGALIYSGPHFSDRQLSYPGGSWRWCDG
jgi:hypothetical protein